jgi:hypothetical protein
VSSPLWSLFAFNKRTSRRAVAAGGRCRRRPGRRSFLLAFERVEPRYMFSGTWQETDVSAVPSGLGTMMLLPDGSVLAQGGGQTASWYKLTPDSTGNYVNGTWSQAGSMNFSRLYFASNVLSNDKVFLVGGEYSNATTTTNGSLTNTAEMYDMATNTWTNLPPVPSSLTGGGYWMWGTNNADSGTPFGDDPSTVLPNGKILCGFIFSEPTLIFDPTTNAWSQGPAKQEYDPSDEEGFVKLNNGNILCYDVNRTGGIAMGAQIFIPSANGGAGGWTLTGQVPRLPLTSTALGKELGPGSLLSNGKVLFLGATGHTALYTPGPTNVDPGSWTQGPDILNASSQLMGADDAPSAVLPNGHILFTADSVSTVNQSGSNLFNPPTEIFDYDPTANTISQVAGLANMALSGDPAFIGRMLVLPNGQVLFSSGDHFSDPVTHVPVATPMFFYTPSGDPQFSWRPSIVGVASRGGGSFTMTGTQLNGMSEGAAYGDDAEMAENYPIVELRSATGIVYFATTSNWSSNGVQTGSDLVSTDFALPAGIPAGNYLVTVSASGISSLPVGLHIGTSDLPPAASTGTASPMSLASDATAPSLALSTAAVAMPSSVEAPLGAVVGTPISADDLVMAPIIRALSVFDTMPWASNSPALDVMLTQSISPWHNGPSIAATDALFGMDSFTTDLHGAALRNKK